MIVKSIAERIEEMKIIYTELDNLGLGSQFKEICDFQKICNEYVRSGEGVSGSINLPFLRRRLVYHFPASSYHKCMACLKSY